MLKYVWYDGKVVDIINETPDVKRFFIRIPEILQYDFKPGQFIILDLPLPDFDNSNIRRQTRNFSIASPPDLGNEFELLIVLFKKGIVTPYLFKEIKIGSPVKISSALGKFLLPEKIDKDICFICTGVGIAPFRSMIWHIFNKGISHKNIYLIFGTRYIKDMCYPEELYQLDKCHKSFHFIPTLSREKSRLWKGRKGYVHNVYKELFHDKRPAYFYICGWKNIIFEARDNLLEMGYKREDIKFELYDK